MIFDSLLRIDEISKYNQAKNQPDIASWFCNCHRVEPFGRIVLPPGKLSALIVDEILFKTILGTIDQLIVWIPITLVHKTHIPVSNFSVLIQIAAMVLVVGVWSVYAGVGWKTQ
jgi:hypothetical protein